MTTSKTISRSVRASFVAVAVVRLSVPVALVTGLGACRHLDQEGQTAGFSIVEPTQRHPIMVSQQPSSLNLTVPRGSSGLTPQQRASLVGFLDKYAATDGGNSKLVISAPSGAANEIAFMHAVQEIRALVSERGFPETIVSVEAYHEDRKAQPPVRVSYQRYVAEAPTCGRWPTNLANEPSNLPYPNMGCANQRNLAAMVANPADLLGPRTMTPRAAERGHVHWEKYTKGESTTADKKQDEKVQVQKTE